MTFIEKVNFVILIFTFIYVIFGGTIVSCFIDFDEYINNSEVIELSGVKFINHKREGYGYGIGSGSGKEVFAIKANDIYYNLLFYEKYKGDYYFKQVDVDELRKANYLVAKINYIEFEKHKGTIEDPIPVFSFAFASKEYVWNIETYEYNVKQFLLYENVLGSNLITMLICVFGASFVFAVFLRFSR